MQRRFCYTGTDQRFLMPQRSRSGIVIRFSFSRSAYDDHILGSRWALVDDGWLARW